MEMFFLIVSISSSVVMPQAYTKDECMKIQNELKDTAVGAICIKAPASDGYKGAVCQPGASVCQVVK